MISANFETIREPKFIVQNESEFRENVQHRKLIFSLHKKRPELRISTFKTSINCFLSSMNLIIVFLSNLPNFFLSFSLHFILIFVFEVNPQWRSNSGVAMKKFCLKVSYQQRDIELLFEGLGDKCKNIHFGNFWGYFEKDHIYSKNCGAYFFGQLVLTIWTLFIPTSEHPTITSVFSGPQTRT